MLAAPSRPIFERLGLEPADQLCGLRTLPQAGVTVLLCAADPPALPWQPVRLAHDQHSELGLAALSRLVIDKTENPAQRAHLGPGEIVAEQAEHFGISDRLPGRSAGDQDRANLLWVR